jgi:TolB-like protein
MADVFLSYARADQDAAVRLASALEASGYSVWWDRHLTGGSEFARDIERELDASEVVLVVWSEAARHSPWVKDEATVGQEAGKLVAVSLDAQPPPLGFRQFHAIDLSAWQGDPSTPVFRGLKDAIESRRSGEEPETRQRALPSRQPSPSIRRWLLPVLLLAVAAYFLVPLFWSNGGESAPASPDATPRLAVSQLIARGPGAEEEMAAALTENIASGLSRFPHLHVVTPRADSTDLQADATYLLQGALVRAGPTLRLTVQLFKTATGEQVWGEHYDRPTSGESVLEIQDDLTAKVVASVADSFGALMRDLSAGVDRLAPEAMTPYEAVLRHLIYRQRLGPAEHKATRDALEHAVTVAPADANVLAALAAVYTDEYKHSYNVSPGSLDRALAAAREAVTLEPNNAFATFVLAETHYFRQDLGAFRAAAERAIELNPHDSDAMAMIGILLCYGGSWDRGAELSRRAMALNPHHPGWYRFGIAFGQLRREEYAAALDTAQRINLPQYFADPYVRTVAHAYLGNTREAAAAREEFVALWPREDFDEFQERHLERWFFASPELIDLTLRGLELAGLPASSSSPAR